jgi:hypothetical protein
MTIIGGNNVRALRDADNEYYRLMTAISDDAERHRLAELNACCGENPHDPIAGLTCRLALYLVKQNTAREFVERFPTSRNLQPLWALDEIALFAPNGPPMLFQPDGPVDIYIAELFELVEKGDKRALQKYLNLYLHADGAYAELIEVQLEELFSEHAKVVLDNWASVKSNQRVLATLRASLTADERGQMRLKFEPYCYINVRACRELTVALR